MRSRQSSALVVLLDREIPGIHTSALVAEIVRASPHTRVLMLSARSEGNAVKDSMWAGASGYVGKHHHPAYLMEAIKTVAAGEGFMCRDTSHFLRVD